MSSPIYVHLGAQREFSNRRSDKKLKKKRFCEKWRIQGDRFFFQSKISNLRHRNHKT